MCDHEHYSRLNDRLTNAEERQKEIDDRLTTLERDQLVIDTKQDEQINTLFKSVQILRNVVYVFSLLMLLALIYGALGPRGFNAVTNAANTSNTSSRSDGHRIAYEQKQP